MRKKLAQEPFEEKIRKVAQLIHLAKTFPKRTTKLSQEEIASFWFPKSDEPIEKDLK